MNRIGLKGCPPTPMANYMKAMGILRIAHEQTDPGMKGHWEDDCFVLSTSLTEEDLVSFFCDHYIPTPIVSPWNGGSGFYPGDSIRDLTTLRGTTGGRFAQYREVIDHIFAWEELAEVTTVGEIVQGLRKKISGMQPGKEQAKIEGLVTKVETGARWNGWQNLPLASLAQNTDQNKRAWWKDVKKARTAYYTLRRSGSKTALLATCRARLPETSLPWLDAVLTLTGELKPIYNPAFAQGGAEGRLDLSSQFIKHVAGLFITNNGDVTRNLFQSSVLGIPSQGLVTASIGQMHPGRAGGFNQGMGIEQKDFKINPWDLVLMMEGALVLSGAAVKRYRPAAQMAGSIPFTVEYSPAGFTSTLSSGKKQEGSSETWLPLWSQPAGWKEIHYLFGEGRATIGRKAVRTGLEFSRAAGLLGTDRGLRAFERFVYLRRRGDSYVARPAGRVGTRYKPQLEILNELDPILARAKSFMRTLKPIPSSLDEAMYGIQEALFHCALDPAPVSFQKVARALGTFEFLMARWDKTKDQSLARPLYGLSPRWVSACDDGSIEVRIAAALASIRDTGGVGTMRHTLSGTRTDNPGYWDDKGRTGFWGGRSVSEKLANLLQRRLLEAERRSAPSFPGEALLRVHPGDVVLFMEGQCDDNLIEDLLFAFTLIDWSRGAGIRDIRNRFSQPTADGAPLPRAWCLLKLLHSPDPIQGDVQVRLEPRIVNLVLANRIPEACDIATQRLFVSGLAPFRVDYQAAIEPSRLAAALIIPTGYQKILESLVLHKPSTA